MERRLAAIATLRTIGGLDFLKALLFGACHAQLGQLDEAKPMAEAVLRVRPDFRLSNLGLWKLFRREADQQHLLNARRAAGLPD